MQCINAKQSTETTTPTAQNSPTTGLQTKRSQSEEMENSTRQGIDPTGLFQIPGLLSFNPALDEAGVALLINLTAIYSHFEGSKQMLRNQNQIQFQV